MEIKALMETDTTACHPRRIKAIQAIAEEGNRAARLRSQKAVKPPTTAASADRRELGVIPHLAEHGKSQQECLLCDACIPALQQYLTQWPRIVPVSMVLY